MANGTRKPMRQGQQNRRGRGRSRKPQNPLSRNLESNGPDVKIRGTASHIAEKYATLARDALSSGDNVAGESYLQHAEHYNRIIMANQSQQGDGVNGSGAGRGRPNGSGDDAENVQPEAVPDVVASGNSDEGIGDDDGVARTVARTVKSSGNGADEKSQTESDASSEKNEAPGKGGADEASDEAVS